MEEEGLTELVDVSATFCSERCDKGPTVQVGEEILTHADTEKVMGLVRPRIAAIKAPA